MSNFFIGLPESVLLTILILGSVVLLWCIPTAWRMRSVPRDASTRRILQLMFLVRSLRLFLTGICMVGLALGALTATPWLIIAAVIIGLEELYECGMALACLIRIEEREREALAKTPLIPDTELSKAPVRARFETHSVERSWTPLSIPLSTAVVGRRASPVRHTGASVPRVRW